MTERIQKIIAARGVTSRRKAEELISAGRVTCNGRICLLGESADPDEDIILLDGKPLPSGGGNTYIMLHKPRGFENEHVTLKTLCLSFLGFAVETDVWNVKNSGNSRTCWSRHTVFRRWKW